MNHDKAGRSAGRFRTVAMIGGLLLLAGCGKTPKGQVLAIVDGEDITVQQLDAELAGVRLPANADPKALRKSVLEALIDRSLQTAEARRQGLDDTTEFRLQRQRAEEELLVAMLGRKVAETTPMPADEDIRNYIAAHPLQFARRQRLTLDQLSFAAPADQSKLAQLAQASSLDAAAEMLRRMGIAAVRGQGAVDTGRLDPEVAERVARAGPGQPVLLPQGERIALGVIVARAPITLSPASTRLVAARAARGLDLYRESQAQIAAARTAAEISYEPGWEPVKQATR